MKHVKIAVLWAVLTIVAVFVLTVDSHAAGIPLQQMHDSTVLVSTFDDKGKGQGHGSGVVVSDYQVLTAYHVIENADAIVVEFANGVKRHAAVIWEDPEEDIALIGLAVPEGTLVSPVRCSTVEWGEEVIAVGHPLAMRWVLSRGYVASLEEPTIEHDPTWITLDLTIVFGNSGGPIFDLAGNVVGIADAFPSVAFGGGFAPDRSISGFSFMVPTTAVCGRIPNAPF